MSEDSFKEQEKLLHELGKCVLEQTSKILEMDKLLKNKELLRNKEVKIGFQACMRCKNTEDKDSIAQITLIGGVRCCLCFKCAIEWSELVYLKYFDQYLRYSEIKTRLNSEDGLDHMTISTLNLDLNLLGIFFEITGYRFLNRQVSLDMQRKFEEIKNRIM